MRAAHPRIIRKLVQKLRAAGLGTPAPAKLLSSRRVKRIQQYIKTYRRADRAEIRVFRSKEQEYQ